MCCIRMLVFSHTVTRVGYRFRCLRYYTRRCYQMAREYKTNVLTHADVIDRPPTNKSTYHSAAKPPVVGISRRGSCSPALCNSFMKYVHYLCPSAPSPHDSITVRADSLAPAPDVPGPTRKKRTTTMSILLYLEKPHQPTCRSCLRRHHQRETSCARKRNPARHQWTPAPRLWIRRPPR